MELWGGSTLGWMVEEILVVKKKLIHALDSVITIYLMSGIINALLKTENGPDQKLL